MKPISLLLPLLLTACSSGFQPETLPELSKDEIRWFRLEQMENQRSKQSSLLAVQGLGEHSSRWIQSDLFGAPLARLIASPKGWQSDGFVAPNPAAKRLFSALFPYIQSHSGEALSLNIDGKMWHIAPLEQPKD